MDERLPIGLRFSILHRAFKRHVDAMLAEKDLTGVQLGVIGQIGKLRREGIKEINQRDLESATRVSHSTMTEILKKLEKKGFVVCSEGEKDRRCKRIEPTEHAEALGDELGQMDEEVFSLLCRGMDDGQIAALREAIDIMLANAKTLCRAKGCNKTI